MKMTTLECNNCHAVQQFNTQADWQGLTKAAWKYNDARWDNLCPNCNH